MALTSVLRRAGRSRWVDRAGRVGFAARGLLYGAVAILALEIPLGLRDRPPEGQGALSLVADRPLGRALLPVVGLGLAGYAIWRLGQAVRYRRGRESVARAWVSRVALVVPAGFHATLAALALSLAANGGGGGNERRETANAFDLPLGRVLVAAAGAGILAAALYNVYVSSTARFRKRLREKELRRGARGWVIALGVAGHAARAVVFGLLGLFLLRAAVQYDAREAIGVDGALRKIAERAYGEALLASVAAGLFAYASFCFVQARYTDT